tara:strand:- start:40 stop:393 length:354 start_codon:yes stop_codon:yes gene_type:complete
LCFENVRALKTEACDLGGVATIFVKKESVSCYPWLFAPPVELVPLILHTEIGRVTVRIRVEESGIGVFELAVLTLLRPTFIGVSDYDVSQDDRSIEEDQIGFSCWCHLYKNRKIIMK